MRFWKVLEFTDHAAFWASRQEGIFVSLIFSIVVFSTTLVGTFANLKFNPRPTQLYLQAGYFL